MRHLRTVRVVAALGLMTAACSGSDLVDIGTPGMGASSGTTPTGGNDAEVHGSSSGSTPPPGTGAEGGATDDSDAPADGSIADATLDGDSLDGDSTTDAAPSNDAGVTTPPDATGGTFACGPTLRCDPGSEYCNIGPSLGGPVTNIIVPLEGGSSRYSCLALPACDAASECLCIQGGGSILQPVSTNLQPVAPQCSCNDSKGDITRTCTGGGIVPAN